MGLKSRFKKKKQQSHKTDKCDCICACKWASQEWKGGIRGRIWRHVTSQFHLCWMDVPDTRIKLPWQQSNSICSRSHREKAWHKPKSICTEIKLSWPLRYTWNLLNEIHPYNTNERKKTKKTTWCNATWPEVALDYVEAIKCFIPRSLQAQDWLWEGSFISHTRM